MNDIKIFTVGNLSEPTRVDLYLISQIPELTRSSAKLVVMQKLLKVDGNFVKPNFRVSNGARVEVDVGRAEVLLNKDEFAKLQPVKMNIDVVYEDENLIVVNKKSGEVVHPVTSHTDDTLLNGLLYREIEKSKNLSAGDSSRDFPMAGVARIRPIHRLDKDTSGLVLFSKTKPAHEFYSKEFEAREVQKTYYAVVSGDFQEYLKSKTNREFFEVFTYIGRSNVNTKQFQNTSNEKGSPARTKVFFERYWNHPVKKKKTYSLLKLIPETGRTHQLRVHLAGIGFPILGDELYEGENFSRLMLHAYSLKIKLFPSNTEKIFTSKLPREF